MKQVIQDPALSIFLFSSDSKYLKRQLWLSHVALKASSEQKAHRDCTPLCPCPTVRDCASILEHFFFSFWNIKHSQMQISNNKCKADSFFPLLCLLEVHTEWAGPIHFLSYDSWPQAVLNFRNCCHNLIFKLRFGVDIWVVKSQIIKMS